VSDRALDGGDCPPWIARALPTPAYWGTPVGQNGGMGGQGYDRETKSLLGRLFARSDDLDRKFFPNAINSPLRLWLDGFYQGHPFLGGLLRGVVAGTVLFLVLGLFGRFRDPWLLLIFAIAFGVVMTIFTYLYYRGAPRD
jgi:hypothetical protein